MSELDATMERELEAMDEALERGAVTATTAWERELQEVALAVAAEAPKPDGEFAAELGERVRDGFPRERRRVHPTLPKLRRPPMIALAGAASILAALAVAVPLLSGGEDDATLGDQLDSAAVIPETDSPAQPEQSLAGGPRRDLPGGGVIDSSRATLGSSGDRGFAPGRSDRRIERSASLTLEAPAGELDRVADEIVTVTDRNEGFVLRSEVTSEDGLPGGEFELRIPADRLQPALRDLSKLGDVRTRSQSGDDVTRAFVSVGDVLEGAQAERRGLLRRLENAQSDTEAESIRRRLDLNASEISGLRGRLRDLRLRTDYASVSIGLEQAESGDDDSGASGDGLGGALEDALGSLSDSVEVLVRTLGVAIPIAILGGLLWLGGRTARRRRREAALQG